VVSQASLSPLQLVQNAAAHRCEHISPILSALHWLPVCNRIDFKILFLAYKSLNGLTPLLPLCDLFQRYVPSQSLWSADHLTMVVPKTRLKLRGDQAFAITEKLVLQQHQLFAGPEKIIDCVRAVGGVMETSKT